MSFSEVTQSTPNRDPLFPILRSKFIPNVRYELGQQRERFITSDTNHKFYGTLEANGLLKVS